MSEEYCCKIKLESTMKLII